MTPPFTSGRTIRAFGGRSRWLILIVGLGCSPSHEGRHDGAAPSASTATVSTHTAVGLQGNPGPLWAEGVASLVHHCDRAGLVESLLARAASISLADVEEPFAHYHPIAQIIAYCDPRQEPLLSSWLESPSGRGRAAARALAALASTRHRLDPASIVALLRRPDLEETWFALSQLDVQGASLRARIAERAAAQLKAAAPRPYWVVRSLANGDTSAVPTLVEVIRDGNRDLSLRAAAVDALAEFGTVGRDALLSLMPLEPQELALVAVSKLGPFEQSPHALVRLLEAAGDAPAGLPLRCAIEAKTVEPRKFRSCPEEAGRVHQLAWLDAFQARVASSGKRDAKFRNLLEAEDPLVVERALLVLERFPERPELDEGIRLGLRHDNPGVVGRAARVLANVARSHPSAAPSRDTVQELKQALLGPKHAAAIPTRIALIDAVSALHVLSLKGALPSLCDSKVAAVRSAVDQALAGMRAPACEKTPRAAPPLEAGAPRFVRLEFQVGGLALHLDLAPTLPEAILDRVLLLARSEGLTRTPVVVSPAREWIRIGDPEGDEFPNGTVAPTTSAPSGVPFERFSVTLWQHGIDAVSTELLIALEDRPDFDADHTFVGTASANWAEVPTGSVVDGVVVRDLSSGAPSGAR